MAEFLSQQRRAIIGTLVALNLAVVVATAAWGLWIDPTSWKRFWSLYTGEDTAMTWFSSLQLVFIGVVAYGVWVVTRIEDLRSGGKTPYRWIWLFFAAGFAFLACDEALWIHEWVRNEILRPNEIFTRGERLQDGDVILPFYLLVGLGMLYAFLQVLKQKRSSLVLFLSAVAIMVPVVVLDSFRIGFIDDDYDLKRIFWIGEEIAENGAALLFLVAFLLIFFDRLERFVPSRAPDAT